MSIDTIVIVDGIFPRFSATIAANTPKTTAYTLRGQGPGLGGNTLSVVLSTVLAGGTSTPTYTATARLRVNGGAWRTLTKDGSSSITVAEGTTVKPVMVAQPWVDGDTVEVELTSNASVAVPVIDPDAVSWAPHAVIGTQPDDAETDLGIFDSIGAGVGRSPGNAYKLGVLNTARRDFRPCITAGIPGGKLLDLVALGANSPLYALYAACRTKNIVIQAQTNDLHLDAGQTADNIAAGMATMAARIAAAAAPGTRIFVTTCMPVGNPGINTGDASVSKFYERTRLVELVRRGIPGTHGYIDLARFYEGATGRNSNLWPDPTLTENNAELHPTDAGYDLAPRAFPSLAENLAMKPALLSAPADEGVVTLRDRLGQQIGGSTAAVLQVKRLGDNAPLPTGSVTLTDLRHGQWRVSKAAGLPACVAIIDTDTANIHNLASGSRYRAVLSGADGLGYVLVQAVDPRTGELFFGAGATITDASGGRRQMDVYPYGAYVALASGGGRVDIDPESWWGLSPSERVLEIPAPAPDPRIFAAATAVAIDAMAYPSAWPRPATSATFELHLAGATSTGACGCNAKSACGSSHGAETKLYSGDTRERVFFLLDAGKSVVALPAGVYVEIWDDDAKRADATVSLTDPARWVGTLSIGLAAWESLTPGAYWLRVFDGDDHVVTVQPLTVLVPGSGA